MNCENEIHVSYSSWRVLDLLRIIEAGCAINIYAHTTRKGMLIMIFKQLQFFELWLSETQCNHLDVLVCTATRTNAQYTRVGTLIVAAIYLQLIQNRYMFRSFTVLQCSHQHCV